jgi:predicted nucleic acid-binding protein
LVGLTISGPKREINPSFHPISFADSIIAATAERERAVLVHKDPEFAALEGTIRMKSLPHKL